MATRDQLHARLDAQCDAQRLKLEASLAQLEEDRERGHEIIEAMPESLLITLTSAELSQTRPDLMMVDPATGHTVIAEAKSTPRIQLYEPIKHLIRSLDPDREVTSPIVYDALRQTIPELAMEDQRKLRARIAGTLSRLADEKVLKIWKAGSGSVPHTYKITPTGYRSVMDALNEGAKIHS